MKQEKMLKCALMNKYAVPAFNFTNFEILKGVVEACKETKSPLILQISESSMDYFGDEFLFGFIQSIRKIKHPISVHLDHGKSMEVVCRAIKLGFDSVMFDGSMLSFEDNIKQTRQVVKLAHKKGVSVEGELGVIKSGKDEMVKEFFTNPKKVNEFVKKTKVDSLAVSIGTSHGINKHSQKEQIRFDILQQIENEIPNVPLVLHGASLIEDKYVETINKFGGKLTSVSCDDNLLQDVHKTNICKINMDTDLRLAYISQTRKLLSSKKKEIDPRVIGKFVIEEIKKCAISRIKKVYKSQNKV